MQHAHEDTCPVDGALTSIIPQLHPSFHTAAVWSQGAKRDVDGFALTLGGGEGVDVKAGAKKLQAGAQQLLGQVESQAGAGAGGDGSAGGSDWQVFHISYQSNVTFTVSSQKMTLGL